VHTSVLMKSCAHIAETNRLDRTRALGPTRQQAHDDRLISHVHNKVALMFGLLAFVVPEDVKVRYFV
jgi:hypothetical protein